MDLLIEEVVCRSGYGEYCIAFVCPCDLHIKGKHHLTKSCNTPENKEGNTKEVVCSYILPRFFHAIESFFIIRNKIFQLALSNFMQMSLNIINVLLRTYKFYVFFLSLYALVILHLVKCSCQIAFQCLLVSFPNLSDICNQLFFSGQGNKNVLENSS